jgi:OmpA-OmpF porin, OOP family
VFLSKQSYDIIDKLVSMLKENPDIKVEVYGHTDKSGTDEKSNEGLSGKRAKVVAEYLIKKGIEESRVSFKGFGSKKPIASNSNDTDRTKNRRTEFFLK